MSNRTATTVQLRLASVDDIPAIKGHLVGAAHWMNEAGIRQWVVSQFTTAEITSWMEGGEAYVATVGDKIAGSVRIMIANSDCWPEMSGAAQYICKLVVDRYYAGTGMGQSILLAAERQAKASGARYMRLDTDAYNKRLVRYYAEAGYTRVEDRDLGTWLAARFEKLL